MTMVNATIDDFCRNIDETMEKFGVSKKYPHFVVVTYEKKDAPTLVDGLLIENGKIIQAWDYSGGKITEGKTLDARDPEFDYKEMTVAELVKETFHCPKHPIITNIEVNYNHLYRGEMEIKGSIRFDS